MKPRPIHICPTCNDESHDAICTECNPHCDRCHAARHADDLRNGICSDCREESFDDRCERVFQRFNAAR